jgi:hypothetical protein
MNSISRFFGKLAILLRRDEFRSNLDEEMAFYREMAERDPNGCAASRITRPAFPCIACR